MIHVNVYMYIYYLESNRFVFHDSHNDRLTRSLRRLCIPILVLL
jgi:branched-subunit amino acid aminotransferase/4-amino-4-deoxychorismate lyase